MAQLSFKDIKFEDKDGFIKVVFLRIYYFNIDRTELVKIAHFKIENGNIAFENITEDKARRKLMFLLEKNFNNLKNSITKKKCIYIHQNSGIPLIGNISFGIIDRGTSVIEVKPLTGCNIDCVYCSVDQSKRSNDFIVEKDYLIAELKKMVEFKLKHGDNLEIHIGSNGEPLLYADIVPLIKGISLIKGVKYISLETNGTLLTKKMTDELIGAGLTQLNLSINALDDKISINIANSAAYNLNKITKIAKYVVGKIKLIIAPVWIPGVNDNEIPRLIEFAKEIKADIGIQNFLEYERGKQPVKQMDFSEFIVKLKGFEREFRIPLLNKHANITQIKALPKPFKKGDTLQVEIKCDGRFNSEKIAVNDGRNISVLSCNADSGTIRIKILRSKHNIYLAKQV